MPKFNFTYTDNAKLLHLFAEAFNIKYDGGDTLKIDPPGGNMVMRLLPIEETVHVLLVDGSLNEYYYAKRMMSPNRYYVLHFEDFYVSGFAKFSVDGEMLEKKNVKHSIVRLTSNIFYNTEELAPNTSVKLAKVFFSEDWLKKYLGVENEIEVIQKYIMLKTAGIGIEPLDVEYLKLMDELSNFSNKDPLHTIYLQNRVRLLIERFFTRLTEKLKKLDEGTKIPERYIPLIMQANELLMENLNEKPPTIDTLAKHVGMSTTLLKTLFKQMYGSSINKHYQVMRLIKAKDMLINNKANVKDIVDSMGYKNSSIFTETFTEHFKASPLSFVK